MCFDACYLVIDGAADEIPASFDDSPQVLGRVYPFTEGLFICHQNRQVSESIQEAHIFSLVQIGAPFIFALNLKLAFDADAKSVLAGDGLEDVGVEEILEQVGGHLRAVVVFQV